MKQELSFNKYQGTGNDFVILDNQDGRIELEEEQVAFICDRKFGIGADGLMLLQRVNGFDFEMIYYNADGKLGSMCGNGGRCIVAFAYKLGLFTETARFLAVDGPHYATILDKGTRVRLQMRDVDAVLRVDGDFVLDTGSPHVVRKVNGLRELDVFAEGKRVRNSAAFVKEGINVNFVEPAEAGYSVRTYERGVENETLACGTGVTAVALAMAYESGISGQTDTCIQVPGGELLVSFCSQSGERFTEVFLEGPAIDVFEGKINV